MQTLAQLEFNQLLLEKIDPVFSEFGLRLAGQFGFYSRFDSEDVSIVIGHDPARGSKDGDLQGESQDDHLMKGSEVEDLHWESRGADILRDSQDDYLKGSQSDDPLGESQADDLLKGSNDEERLRGSNVILIGRNSVDAPMIDIDDEVFRVVFGCSISIADCPVDIFLDRLAEFIQWEGSALLRGDRDKMAELEAYAARSPKDGAPPKNDPKNCDPENGHPVAGPFDEADRAWAREDLEDFVAEMDAIDAAQWKPAYKMKYQIARQLME